MDRIFEHEIASSGNKITGLLVSLGFDGPLRTSDVKKLTIGDHVVRVGPLLGMIKGPRNWCVTAWTRLSFRARPYENWLIIIIR
jgi:hypothetical protein